MHRVRALRARLDLKELQSIEEDLDEEDQGDGDQDDGYQIESDEY